MNRRTVTVMVALVLVGALTGGTAVAEPTTGDRYSVGGGDVWNAAEELQSNNETNETIEKQRQKIKELQNENSRLKTKIVAKNGEIQKLEFRLNQSEKQTGFSVGQSERMREMGAWDPEEKEPALVIVRDHGFGPVVYQYVGPNNGQHSFNGQSAWVEVAKPEEEVRKAGNFSFSLMWTLPGQNKTHTVSSFGEYRTLNRDLENKLNSPAGFTAWSRWNNEQRQSAESFRSQTLLLGLVVIAGLMYGAAWVESKQNLVLDRRKRKKKRSQANRLDGQNRDITAWLASLPVLGTVYEKLRKS